MKVVIKWDNTSKKMRSKIAGVEYPGHSDDPDNVKAAYRANPELQETIFTAFTVTLS